MYLGLHSRDFHENSFLDLNSHSYEHIKLRFDRSVIEGTLVGTHSAVSALSRLVFNPLNPELNPICYLLALLAYHFLHVSRIMVKSLTLRLLMSYIYGAHILDVSRSHTTTHHSR